MQIKSRILTTLRVINIIVDNLESKDSVTAADVFGHQIYSDTQDNPADTLEKFKDYNKDMPDDYLVKLLDKAGIPREDYAITANILKSMALMTKGHVGTIRNPEGFDPDKSYSWSEYFKLSEHFFTLLNHLGVNLSKSPTKEDYALANKMLRVLGSSILDEEEVRKMFQDLEIEKDFGMPEKTAAGKNLYIPTTLYRGLQKLSFRAYKKVTTIGYIWDIGKSVSTSTMREIAENFASDYEAMGYNILFVINNPKRQGFVADNLSAFEEDEVILSGKLKVTGSEPADIKRSYAIIYVDLI